MNAVIKKQINSIRRGQEIISLVGPLSPEYQHVLILGTTEGTITPRSARLKVQLLFCRIRYYTIFPSAMFYVYRYLNRDGQFTIFCNENDKR